MSELFMVIESFCNQYAKSVYRRFRDKRRMMPEWPDFVSGHVSADLGRRVEFMVAAA